MFRFRVRSRLLMARTRCSWTIVLLALSFHATLALAQQNRLNTPQQANEVAHFTDSQNCALCHASAKTAQAMRDARDRGVAPYDLWSGSMMANSAVDPYWRAAVSAETLATPSQKSLIEEVCTRCHAPMRDPAVGQATSKHPAPQSANSGRAASGALSENKPDEKLLAFLEPTSAHGKLASDGVSCTVCHQISPEGLGSDESFTGGFVLNKQSLIYGPHANPVTMPMQRHVGYTPTQSDHILTSAMCATCHTLITESHQPTGELNGGRLHEQSPYLEWRNSSFNNEVDSSRNTGRSCQNCHMPVTDVDGQAIATRLAHNPGGRDFPFLGPRQPFGRHTFAGGNSFMLALLRDNRKQLGIETSTSIFDSAIVEARKMLSTQTAKLEIELVQSTNATPTLEVAVKNLAGHKFPTAYPSRRAWLQVVARDATMKVVYSSGTFNKRGQLVDQQGVELASERAGGPVQPHYRVISRPGEVQIYESIMGDIAGEPTFTLLRGSQFIKDNRLLPQGWSSGHADAEATQPQGIDQDSDFVAGEDRVTYQLPVAPGVYEVTVSLHFQSLSSRYIDELLRFDSPAINAFRDMYTKADCTPETISTFTQTVTVR